MKNIGLPALWAMAIAFVLSTVLFVAGIAAAYVVDEYTSPGWNEQCVPAATLQ